jgi:hypothetical protein
VRGLDVDPGDLDFVVDDAHIAGRIFGDLLVEPVTRLEGWVAEWGGRAFHGALFEWVANVDPALDAEPHEQGRAAASRLETVIWCGHRVRVPPLELQLATAIRCGFNERAAKIRQAMAG